MLCDKMNCEIVWPLVKSLYWHRSNALRKKIGLFFWKMWLIHVVNFFYMYCWKERGRRKGCINVLNWVIYLLWCLHRVHVFIFYKQQIANTIWSHQGSLGLYRTKINFWYPCETFKYSAHFTGNIKVGEDFEQFCFSLLFISRIG